MKSILMNVLYAGILSMGMCTTATATIINTLNGNNYEWLEVTETAGMTRSSVEELLADPGSALTGYRYATRAETEALLLSYIAFTIENDGVWTSQTAGASAFIDDFGWTDLFAYPTIQSTLDEITGLTIEYDLYRDVQFIYGATDECGESTTCIGATAGVSLEGIGTAGIAHSDSGFDSTFFDPVTWSYGDSGFAGSLLVRVLPIPESASLVLLGIGLVGLAFYSNRGKKI